MMLDVHQIAHQMYLHFGVCYAMNYLYLVEKKSKYFTLHDLLFYPILYQLIFHLNQLSQRVGDFHRFTPAELVTFQS